ncbi:MAG: TonB-dependent receptor [Prevotella sp.]
MTLKSAFELIEKQSGMSVDYDNQVINVYRVVNVNGASGTVERVLKKLLAGTGYKYEIKGKHILITKSNATPKKERQQSSEKTIRVTGKVVDSSGEPVIGATVRQQDNNEHMAVTDIDGNFSMDADEGSNILISYIGFNTKSVKAGEHINIHLEESSNNLNEVVVVGYGTMKKGDLTGAIAGVSTKDFNKGFISSPTQMLQGRVTGVNITNNGGEPGAGVTIRVRGSNSIRSGQDPLYVVDGVPLNISDDQQPAGGTISGVGVSGSKNPLEFINPDDIERIDILKDASAAAIYGARGANGVIMITTKKGGEGRMKVTYSTYATLSWLPEKIDVMSADEYRETAEKYGYTIVDGGASTDWQDEIFRTSFSHSHNITVSGGMKGSSYRASLAYQDQQGIIKTSSEQKYNGRFYFSQKLLNDRLLLELNTTVSRIDNRRVPIGQSGGSEGDLILSALRLNPTFPIKNEDGSYYQYSQTQRNPVAMLNLTRDKTQTDRAIFNATATLDLVKGLKYKFNVAFDEMKASRKVEQKEELIYMDDGGTFDVNNVEAHNLLIENYFTYNLNLKDKHKFDFLLGHSYQRTRDYVYGFAETGFFIEDIGYRYDLSLSDKSDQISGTSDITINELQSFFGRVNYNYLDRYLFTANLRIDGSTKFGKNNRYGTFPSAAFAWRLSEEPWIKCLNVFDNLKARVSWGITGNQEIPSKISHALLGSTGKSTIFGVNGSTVTGITLTRTPNPDLKWEKSEQLDLGLDFSFFGGRLNGSFDYFHKVTKDVLLQIPSASPAPTSYVWRNISDMKIINNGIEIGINGVIIQHKDFQWDASINLSTAKNEIKNLPVEYYTIGKPSGPGFDNETAQIIKSGYAIGTFWGRVFEGFDEDGKSVYKKDADGNDVYEKIGCAQPDFTANLSTTVTWKNWALQLNFNGVFGNDIYNNLANVVENRSFLADGYNTTLEAANNTAEAIGNAAEYSSRYIEDGSYLRLTSATLSYDFNLRPNKYISGLRVYMTGNNLFCITSYSGYDPEVDALRTTNGIPTMGIGWTQYPKARSLSLGVNIQF